MKILFKFCSRLALMGLVFAIPTFSQAAPTAAEQPKPTPFVLEIRNGVIMDNGKPAGTATIGNILDYFVKKGEKFGIILGPGVADLQISDLVLNYNWDESDAAKVFGVAIGSAVEDQVQVIQTDIGVFRLTLRQDTTRQTQVFNLTDYLNPDGKADDKTIQDKISSLTDIIYKTLHDVHPMNTDAVQPHYQFHKGANLLVVIGTPEALTIANQVVNALQPTDGSPQSQTLIDKISKLGETDPMAAIARVQAYPNASVTAKEYAELQDILAAVQARIEVENDSRRGKVLQQDLDTLKKLMLDMKWQLPNTTPPPSP